MNFLLWNDQKQSSLMTWCTLWLTTMAMEHEAFEDVFPINIWGMFHCHGWFTGRYLNSLLLAQPLRNLITINNNKKKHTLENSRCTSSFPINLKPLKAQPFCGLPKKMVLVSYVFPRHAHETLELNKYLRGFLATVFPCSRKNIAKTQGARKGVDHLQEILGKFSKDRWLGIR